MKKSFLCKCLKALAPIIISAGICIETAMVSGCSSNNINNDKRSNNTINLGLKKQEQIIEDLDIFQNADLSYIKFRDNEYLMLENNGEKSKIPLIVDKSFTDSEQAEIKEVVDEYNQMMSKINERYQYEIYFPGEELKTDVPVKVSIFSEELPKQTLGLAHFETSGNPWIKIDPIKTLTKDELKNKQPYESSAFIETLKHEMLHIIGFKDVYDIENYNTLLKDTFIIKDSLILYTPTDISNLCLLYYNQHREVDEENRTTKIKEISENLENYRLEYLNKVTNRYNNNYSKIDHFGTIKILRQYEGWNFTEEVLVSNGKYKQTFTNLTTGEKTTFVNTYDVVGNGIFLNNCRGMNKSQINENFLGCIVNNNGEYQYMKFTKSYIKYADASFEIFPGIIDIEKIENTLNIIYKQEKTMINNISIMKNRIVKTLELIPNNEKPKNLDSKTMTKKKQIEI